jgi:hypothetical protein
LIPTPPNTPIHLESSISAIPNQKEIPSENPKQPTLVPHLRVDTQNLNLSTIIHKPIRTRQATITLEFLSLPLPKSPPLPPKDPKPTTTQGQTKKSLPSVEQPTIKKTANPTADLHLFATTVPPPIPVKCHTQERRGAADLCRAVFRLRYHRLSMSSQPIHPLRVVSALHHHHIHGHRLCYCIAKETHKDLRSFYCVRLKEKGKGRVFLGWFQEARNRELIFHDWFRKKKKKKIKVVQEASGCQRRKRYKAHDRSDGPKGKYLVKSNNRTSGSMLFFVKSKEHQSKEKKTWSTSQ